MDIITAAQNAKLLSPAMAQLSGEQKNAALKEIVHALKANAQKIFDANAQDLEQAQKQRLAAPIIKRLTFNQGKLDEVLNGLDSLIGLEEPVNKTQLARRLDDGLELYRVSCPIGVIGVIFESRPDALVQISSLCLKSGNCSLLKGGSEALNTNRALFETINSAAVKAGIPQGAMILLETRQDVNDMLNLSDYIDLIIPRGSNEFVKYIMEHTSIPVMGHADGICHTYADKYADIDMALKLIKDSKTQYVSVCNATETLLVHKDIALNLLPALKRELDNVTLLGCEETRRIIDAAPASEQDWQTEYLDYKLSIRIIHSLAQAIDHINKYGSKHTDCIITQDKQRASLFMNAVDSANVFWNCSTRFSDGFRYGFGAEVGISTNKLHARGPVGLEGLLSYKYKLIGSGNIVADYASGKRKFKHDAMNKDCPL